MIVDQMLLTVSYSWPIKIAVAPIAVTLLRKTEINLKQPKLTYIKLNQPKST